MALDCGLSAAETYPAFSIKIPVAETAGARGEDGLQLQIDTDRPYGIVLEGGGARGAYQIGAWKALREAGIRIKGIAGASVGALNGALMCMDDFEKAEDIWKNITYSRVMDVDDTLMEKVRGINLKNLNLNLNLSLNLDLKGVAEQAVRVLKDGGFDVSPLKSLIEETVDEERIRQSDRELYVTTFSVDEKKAMVLDVKEQPKGEVSDALLASAYFPAFKNEKLSGKRYVDGGSINNVPVDVLLERDYRDIIIIRIYGLGFDTEKVVEIPEGVNVWHIAPRQDLGGILEFDKSRAKKNMKLGYMDAKRFLYGLAGRSYYFDAPQSEAYYFDKMMSELALVSHYITPELSEAEAARMEGYRAFTEQIFPAMAREMKLKPDWNYKDLYLAILEEWAKEMRMTRMRVYTPDEIVQKIHIRLRKLDSILPV